MANDALSAVRQKLLGKLCVELGSLRLQRRSKHLARALRAISVSESGIVPSWRGGVIVVSSDTGVSFLLEVPAGFDTRHDTLPSQALSPIFSHSSI